MLERIADFQEPELPEHAGDLRRCRRGQEREGFHFPPVWRERSVVPENSHSRRLPQPGEDCVEKDALRTFAAESAAFREERHGVPQMSQRFQYRTAREDARRRHDPIPGRVYGAHTAAPPEGNSFRSLLEFSPDFRFLHSPQLRRGNETGKLPERAAVAAVSEGGQKRPVHRLLFSGTVCLPGKPPPPALPPDPAGGFKKRRDLCRILRPCRRGRGAEKRPSGDPGDATVQVRPQHHHRSGRVRTGVPIEHDVKNDSGVGTVRFVPVRAPAGRSPVNLDVPDDGVSSDPETSPPKIRPSIQRG